MANKKTRKRQNKRDRRKAKQTGFQREGTVNPKKVAHHAGSEIGVDVKALEQRRFGEPKAKAKPKAKKPAKKKQPKHRTTRVLKRPRKSAAMKRLTSEITAQEWSDFKAALQQVIKTIPKAGS